MKSLLPLFLLFPYIASAQVRYQDLSFQQALQKATAEGKLLLIQYESENCLQCNEVADKGMSDKQLAALLEQSFVLIKSRPYDRDRAELAAAFNMGEGFGTLFVNQSGTLVHKFPMTTSNTKDYFTQADLALVKAGETLKVNELEKEYRAGNKSFGFLEQLLLKKKELNLETDALLEEYIAALPPDSFQSVNTLQFVASMAPLLSSRPDKFMRSNQEAFERSWYQMPLATRIQINNQIIYKSMQKAISEKDERYAAHVAGFSRAVHPTNSLTGRKAYYLNLLRFYELTGDTAKYFKVGIPFIEWHYMSLSADSIKRVDSLGMMQQLKTAKKDTVREGSVMQVRSMVAYRPVAQSYMGVLNNAAWNIYKKTNNPWRLSTALRWATKALEFYKSPEALDTYAKLAYRLGEKKNAIRAMEEAIALRKKNGFPTVQYEKDLKKMSNNEAVD